MDGSDGNHQRGKTLPETGGLERERKERVPCLRPIQASLRATVFPLLQKLVSFYIILYTDFDWIH